MCKEEVISVLFFPLFYAFYNYSFEFLSAKVNITNITFKRFQNIPKYSPDSRNCNFKNIKYQKTE